MLSGQGANRLARCREAWLQSCWARQQHQTAQSYTYCAVRYWGCRLKTGPFSPNLDKVSFGLVYLQKTTLGGAWRPNGFPRLSGASPADKSQGYAKRPLDARAINVVQHRTAYARGVHARVRIGPRVPLLVPRWVFGAILVPKANMTERRLSRLLVSMPKSHRTQRSYRE